MMQYVADYERSFGVPPVDLTDIPDVPDVPAPPEVPVVFEEPAPVPPIPDGRKRVSNALYEVFGLVHKLEGDFAYQYEYNRDLIEENSGLRTDAKYHKDNYDRLSETVRKERESMLVSIEKQQQMTSRALTLAGRAGLWKWLAAAGWTLALLAGGVVATEKISGSPVDVLAGDAIIMLSNQTQSD